MTDRPRSAILMVSAVLLLVGRPGTVAAAQSGSGPLGRGTEAVCGPVKLLMMTWQSAPDKATATKAERDLRSMLRAKFDSKDWCVIAKGTADGWLTASRFSTDTVLSTMDARLLGQQVRADVVLESEVKAVGSGFEFSGRIVLVRDEHAWLRDRVPKTDPGQNMSQAATFFALRVKEVLKEFEPVVRCLNLAHDQKFAEAVAAAQQGIAAFPEATIARICMASALQGQKKSPDEVLKVISEVLSRDSLSPRALEIAISAYDAKDDQAAFERVAGQFLAIDPSNSRVEDIVARLAQWHRTDAALKFIDKALQDDTENKSLLRLEFRLVYASDRLKDVEEKGEALAKLDTAAVDTAFIEKMYSTYNRDSQPEKVLEWLKRGTDKFPEVSRFTIGFAQQLMAMGRVPEAVEAYKKTLRTHPATKEIRLRIANAYNDLQQVDSAVVWLREARKHGDDTTQIAGVAAQIGNALYTAAGRTKAIADFDKAIPILAFSDSVSATVGAKFLWGASLFVPATIMLQSLEATPSCEVALAAKTRLETAVPLITAGGRAAPDLAGQWLTLTNTQLLPYLEQFIRAKRCS